MLLCNKVHQHVRSLRSVWQAAQTPPSDGLSRRFLLCVLYQVWIVDDGKITFYNGDFDDYRNELVREINAELDEDE